jgi:hypothetical protein
MKITFIDEYEETVAEIDSMPIPRVGDSVYVDSDTFFVTNVTWDLNEKEIYVSLSERKIAEQKDVAIVGSDGLTEAHLASEKANQALKETRRLRTDILTIRQFLRAKK